MSDLAYLVILKDDGTVMVAEINENCQVPIDGKTVFVGAPGEIGKALFDRLEPTCVKH